MLFRYSEKPALAFKIRGYTAATKQVNTSDPFCYYTNLPFYSTLCQTPHDLVLQE